MGSSRRRGRVNMRGTDLIKKTTDWNSQDLNKAANDGSLRKSVISKIIYKLTAQQQMSKLPLVDASLFSALVHPPSVLVVFIGY